MIPVAMGGTPAIVDFVLGGRHTAPHVHVYKLDSMFVIVGFDCPHMDIHYITYVCDIGLDCQYSNIIYMIGCMHVHVLSFIQYYFPPSQISV